MLPTVLNRVGGGVTLSKVCFFLLEAGGLMLALVACIPQASRMQPVVAAAAYETETATPSLTPFQPRGLTQTPFQPVAPTQTPTPTPLPTPTPFPSTYTRFGIAFTDTSQTIQVVLSPLQGPVNEGRPIRVPIRPGWPCEWADHRSCISLHYQGQVVLATIHSGVAGEGEALRNALEGTWLNAAALSLPRIQENLDSLQGADVDLEQGDSSSGTAHVLAAVRLPADQAADYFSLPVNEGLELAAQRSPEMAAALASEKPILIIETCGWSHPSEPLVPGTSPTSASVYLVVIGE